MCLIEQLSSSLLDFSVQTYVHSAISAQFSQLVFLILYRVSGNTSGMAAREELSIFQAAKTGPLSESALSYKCFEFQKSVMEVSKSLLLISSGSFVATISSPMPKW